MTKLPPARSARGFRAPRPTRFALAVLRLFGGLYLRLAQGTREVALLNPEPLRSGFRAFQHGKVRLLILFRHVEVADGPVVMSAIARELWRYDRRRSPRGNGRLPQPPHAHFLYGKDVLNWAGAGARWIFPRLGGIPVVNTRLDRNSHQAIRDTIVSGAYPLTLAPEGQVTYQMFHVSDLAAGTGTMAHWIERDLVSSVRRADKVAAEDQSRPKSASPARSPASGPGGARPGILLLPVAIAYRLTDDYPKLLADIVKRIETQIGVRLPQSKPMRDTLLAATELVLNQLEAAYAAAYPAVFRNHPTASAEALSDRVRMLCDRILSCAELGTKRRSEKSILRRLFGVRYRAMDLFHREDTDPAALSPTARAWADFRVLDAATMDRHAQIVDILMYLRPEYIESSPSSHRLAEYALNVLDVTNRVAGGNIDSRYSPPNKRARLLAGSPIDAAEVLRRPGTTPKTAINELNREVYSKLTELSADLEARMSADTP